MPSGIPIIDLHEFTPRDVTRASPSTRLVSNVCAAAHDWGFFYVTGHHVSPPLIDRVWTAMHAFFAAPRADKLELLRTKSNPRGYYDRELTKNRRDLKEVFDFGRDDGMTIDGENQWPESLPVVRQTMREYFGACERLAFDVLALLSMALVSETKTLSRHFSPIHTSFIRLNYYPLEDPLDSDAKVDTPALGDQALHHHSDAGALTLLLQDDVGGLQVQGPHGWQDVSPMADTLVVNLGDMMQVWSNDRFTAALHRVRPVTTRPRYSIPFFFNPSYDTNYAPLPTSAGDMPRYRTINWGAFRRARADGDYADLGHEIQIADFRLHS